MKARWFLVPATMAALALPACDSEGAVDGARGSCAQGGAVGTCPEAVTTAEAACERMVLCAAIPRDAEDENAFDWGQCVDRIQRMTPAQSAFVISCIGASGCDDLKIEGSPDTPNGRGFCFEFGDR